MGSAMIRKSVHHKVFSRVRPDYWVCLLLVVATLSVYWPVKDFEFVNFDDPLYVADNRYVQKGLTLETVRWSFTDATRKTNYWVPLTWLSILLDYELYGMNAGGYHLTNVFFHVLNTLLVFIVFRRLTGALWQSAFVAALFALHPLHVESVAWVTERKDVLSTFFWLLTLLSYGGYVGRPGAGRYLLALLLFILGMMSKPMLVTLPFVLLLLDYWPLGRLGSGGVLANLARPATVLKLIWEKGPFFIIIAIAGVATFLTQQEAGAVKSLAAIPLEVRITNVLVAYVSYIGKMFWPARLSFLYPHPGALPAWQWSGALLILGAITYAAFRFAKERLYLAVGWLWYLGTLFPVSGLIVIGPHAMADRYTYVPLIGLYMMMAWGVAGAVARWRYKTMGLALTAAVTLAFFAGAAGKQVRYWQNSMTLMEHALDVNADNTAAHINLGIALGSKGRTADAIRHYREALRIDPNYVDAYNNLGVVLDNQGKTADAIRHYREALRIDPNYAKAHNNLGNALLREGKTEEAIMHYLKTVQIDSGYKAAYYNLGNVFFAQGNFDEAINHYLVALRIDPTYAEAHNNLGSALAKENRIDEAIVHYQKALAIAPAYIDAVKNLAMVYAALGKYDMARDFFHKWIAIRPDQWQAYYSIAGTYARQKKIDESLRWLQKAVDMGFDGCNFLEKDEDFKNIRQPSYCQDLMKNH
ncbi:MAG: tetratricopeptide repeat protein [Desulfobacterales bacterium]|nr:tetratricopeptide repeat protein [Desulfobacterales bacterium]